jgi:hypothetical protein
MPYKLLKAAVLPLVTASALLILFTPALASAQCKPGDVLVGEDEEQYYCMKRSDHEDSPTQKHGVAFCNQKRLVAADQNAIRVLNVALDADRFEMYTSVAKDQKQQLENLLFDAMLDQGLAAAGMALKSAKSLNPYNVNKAADDLVKNGFGHPDIIAALRKIASIKDKPAKAAAYREWEIRIKAARNGWRTAQGVAKDTANANLRMMVGALKLMQGNPQAALLINGLQAGESLLYLLYLNAQVDDLAASSDDRLAQLVTLSSRLKSHVETLVAEKKAWQKTTGYTGAWPICPE